MSIEKEERQRLIMFFKDLSQILSPAVLLRPKMLRNDDDYFEGDFDFLIGASVCKSVFSDVYTLCKNSGIHFVYNQKAVNKKFFRFFIKDIHTTCITVELWTAIEYKVNGKKRALKGESILKAIESKLVTKVEILSLIYITHLYFKNKFIFSKENQFRFKVFIDELQFNSPNTKTLELLLKIKNKELKICDANTIALDLLQAYNVQSNSTILENIRFLKKKISLKWRSMKDVIPMIGPDGVGKGSISDVALTSLPEYDVTPYKKLFRINKLYKLRQMMLSDYKKKPINILDEKIPYYIQISSILSLQIFRLFKKNKIILMDRYFVDYLAVPLRFLDGKSPNKIRCYSIFISCINTPKSMILLGCSDTSLINRKNELPLESVAYLEKLYIEFVFRKQVPETLFISTEEELDTTSLTMRTFLKEHQERYF